MAGAALASDPLGLIGDIYDAALEPSLWPEVLQRITECLNGQIGVFIRSPDYAPTAPVVTVRADPEMLRLYVEHFRDINPIARACATSPAGMPGTDRTLVPRDEFLRSEFYNDFMRPMGSETWLGVALVKGGGSQVTVSRTKRQGDWEVGDLDLFNQLVPHLRRAIEINRRTAHVDGDGFGDPLAWLSDLPHGVFLLGGAGHLLFANRAGEAMFAAGGALSFAHGSLQAATPELTERLLATVKRTASGSATDAGENIMLPRPAGRPLLGLLARLSIGSAWPLHTRPRVMLLVVEPGGADQPNIGFATASPLAPRERECLGAAARGAPTKQIAYELGLSPFTVDQYIGSAMRKLDATSRAQAVAKAHRAGFLGQVD
jgi:DNA-binding CsgD family transcriptional regulator